MKTPACLALLMFFGVALSPASADAQSPREATAVKKIEEYAAHQVAQGLAIAVDPCFSDAQSNSIFEYKNLLSRGILPVLVAIENRGQHTVRIEGQNIYLITSSRESRSLQPLDIRMVVARLRQGSKKKSINLPVPIPRSTSQLAGLDPKLDQLRARLFEMKLIPAGQRDYGYLYYDLSDSTVLQHLESAYLPEVVDVEADQKLVFFEISLQEAIRGAMREKAKGKESSLGQGMFGFAGEGIRASAMRRMRPEQPQAAAESQVPPQLQTPSGQQPIAPILVPKKSEIVLSLLSLVSTRTAAIGDKFYGLISIPVITDDRIVIPVGSYIVGSVRQVKRAGRLKGDAELALDFHSVIFPAGETRSIEARVRSADGYRSDDIQKSEGTIQGTPEKGKQLEAGARNAALGASLGSIVVGGTAQSWRGFGYGGIAGAAAGFGLTLLQRGPDVELPKGTQMTLTLDQDVLLTKK